jgi:hypothetical protein
MIRDALKQIKSSGQMELTKSEKAVKTSFKQIEVIKKEELEDVLEIIEDKENASKAVKQPIKYEITVDEDVY